MLQRDGGNFVYTGKTNRHNNLRIVVAAIRQEITSERGISLKRAPTWAMLADALTKAMVTVALICALASRAMLDNTKRLANRLVSFQLPTLATSQAIPSSQISADLLKPSRTPLC